MVPERFLSFLLVHLLAFSLAGCVGGDLSNSEADDSALVGYVLGVLSTSTLNLKVRMYDGGTDGLDSFTTDSRAYVLSGINYFELDRLELFQGTTTRSSLFNTGEHAHTTATGRSGVTVPLGHRVQFLGAGSTGSGTDLGARPYFELSLSGLAIGSGRYTSATLHLRGVAFSGTVDATTFGALHEGAIDASASLSCGAAYSAGGSNTLQLVLDYTRLLQGVASADSAGVLAAIPNNANQTGLLAEHECFTL